jgi:hypothetical protein
MPLSKGKEMHFCYTDTSKIKGVDGMPFLLLCSLYGRGEIASSLTYLISLVT